MTRRRHRLPSPVSPVAAVLPLTSGARRGDPVCTAQVRRGLQGHADVSMVESCSQLTWFDGASALLAVQPFRLNTSPLPTFADCFSSSLRLVSVAAQKFVAGVLDEAVNTHKRRRLAPPAHQRAQVRHQPSQPSAFTTVAYTSWRCSRQACVSSSPDILGPTTHTFRAWIPGTNVYHSPPRT